jgi:thiosulfate/3-mercaptopyruvate sulfurtransferase
MTTEQTKSKPLITTTELAEMMETEKVVLIDVRDAEEYEEEHIPGAVNIPDVFYYLVDTSPEGMEDFRNHFAKLFGEAGLTGEETAVIYEGGFSLKSPRGYVILEYLGYPKMAVLSNGMKGWKKEAGYPVDNEVPDPAGSADTFPLDPNPDVFVSKDEMLATLDDPDIVRLDVRDEEEWYGESSSPYGVDFVPRKGRIPNATWLDWNMLLTMGEETKGTFNVMEDKGEFKELEEVEKSLAEHGVTKDKEIILYCFKGARTSSTYLAMQMLGYENVRTYIGSWNEWAQDDSLPIEDGAPREEEEIRQ